MSISLFAGIVGLVVISYAVWVRKEKWQDVLFIIGGLLLLIYSISISSSIFIILQIIFILSAIAELVKLSHKRKQPKKQVGVDLH